MESGRTRIETGHKAEQLAEQYLANNGLRLIERNYRCRGGEIDLVMEDERTLVFIEVRYRKHRSFGGAAESVDRRKQLRLIHAAQHYLLRGKHTERACRFDVIAVSPGKTGKPQVHWIKNAIELD
ncbi:MAG: YraN family protein [Pseudomonadota bacterium]